MFSSAQTNVRKGSPVVQVPSAERWTDEERRGEYDRIRRAFIPLYVTTIKNLSVGIGQMREGSIIAQHMTLFVERNDYPPGAQFIAIRLSAVRKLYQWFVDRGWAAARRLTPVERARLDRSAAVSIQET